MTLNPTDPASDSDAAPESMRCGTYPWLEVLSRGFDSDAAVVD